MRKIEYTPNYAKSVIYAKCTQPVTVLYAVAEVLENSDLPNALADVFKAITRGADYLREEAVAEAKKWSKSAPKSVQERFLTDAYNSIPEELVQKLSKVLRDWNSEFTITDFEATEGGFRLKDTSRQRLSDSYIRVLENADVELLERLQVLTCEMQEIDTLIDLNEAIKGVRFHGKAITEEDFANIIMATKRKK